MRPSAPTTLVRYFITHPTAANLIMMALLIVGLLCAGQIRKQFFPDTVNQSITVNIVWDGAGAKDVDLAINAPLSNALESIDGLEEIYVSAYENLSSIWLTFQDGWNMQRAQSDVEAELNNVDLPDNAEQAVIRIASWRDRVADIVISGPVRIDLLAQYADELTTELERAGVTKVNLIGVSNPEIRIDVPLKNLHQHGLTLTELATQIKSEISKNPGGDLEQLGVRLVTGSDHHDIRALNRITVKDQFGNPVELAALADIYAATLNGDVEYRHNGNAAVVLEVDRGASGDTIETQAEVERIIAHYQSTLPQHIAIHLTRARATAIKDRLNILLSNAYVGLGLVLLLLFLFLSARTAFWVAAGIPIALSGALGFMFFLGITINMVSLFALIICLGIIVDDAIVVAEHADALHKRGMRAVDATTAAVKRMFAPVFSASATTIIAFSAITLFGGRFGRFIYDIPITVTLVVIASLIECLLILPAHVYHSLKRGPRKRALFIDRINTGFCRGFDRISRHFHRGIKAIVRWRYAVVIAAVGILLLSIGQITTGKLRFVFFNAPERSVITANVAMQSGSERQHLVTQLQYMDEALSALADEYEKEYGSYPVVFSMSTLGRNVGRELASAATKTEDELGGFSIELIDPDLRPYSAFKFLEDWQERIQHHSNLEELSVRGHRSGPSGDAIDVQLLGHDSAVLKQAAEEVKAYLNEVGGVSAVEDNLNFDRPELILALNKHGERLGLSTAQIASELRQQVNRIELKQFASGRRSTDITLGLPETELSADYFDRVQVRTANNQLVYLADVVEKRYETGFAAIQRESGAISVRVSGEYDLSDEAGYNALVASLSTEILPRISNKYGINWRFRGLKQQEREFLEESRLAAIACCIGIFVVLAWVFASFSRALIILLIVPFGVVGMVWGHIAHSVPLSMLSVVGFIGMAGIIINDSIVLITTIDYLAPDRPIQRAIAEGTTSRLRAVLLTTLTTVFGLAPLFFESSRQAQFLLPTVITISYGLTVGMVIVLIVTPCLIAISADISRNTRATRYLLRHIARR